MTSSSSVRSLRIASRLMIAAMLAFLALALGIGSQYASAHDSLVESSPSANEAVEVAPASATLTFSAEVQSEGTLGPQIELFAVSAVEETAVDLESPATVDGTVVDQALPELAAGDYALNWQVVSSDGHPISGTIPFTVSVGVASVEDAQPSESAPAGFGAAENTEGSTLTNSDAGATGAAERSSTPVPQDSGIPAWAWVLMGLAGVSVVLVSFLVFRRKAADLEASRKPQADEPTADQDDDTPNAR
ncbi:copper resistance protein CopC [Pseudoclavibacter sp. JSM 162008]|uniref:copper resistance CopC family protein n=1 Tax=Pseudoclavibacter sp. JSM 162008 TaxID=3229855 RepID=UPI0035241BCD